LYDAKTRLKELFDTNLDKLGPLVYKEIKGETDVLTLSTVYRVAGGKYEELPNGTLNKNKIIGGQYVKIGDGRAALKADAQQVAAASALDTLSKLGYKKQVPKCYLLFTDNYVEESVTKESILKKVGGDINSLLPTKDKSKYQCKYMSTILAMFCRKRDKNGIKLCLELKADINISDSEGMTPFELLFIGKIKEKTLIMLIKLFGTNNFRMEKSLYENVYLRYTHDFFKTLNIQSY
jgi:hypothetical protein